MYTNVQAQDTIKPGNAYKQKEISLVSQKNCTEQEVLE